MFLKELVEQVRGVSYKPADVSNKENGIPILRASNIQKGALNFDDLVYVKKEVVKEAQFLVKGDVLICTSSGSKDLVGKAGVFYDYNDPVSFGAFCKVLRIKKCNTIDEDFVRLFFNSPSYRRQISDASNGANINNINADNINNLDINIPDLDTQKNAILELNSIALLLRKKEQDLFMLKELICSKYNEMFSKYDGANKELGELANVSSGDALTAPSISEIQDDVFKYVVFGANGVRGYYSKANRKNKCILVGRVGAQAGNVHYFDGDFFATEHALVVETFSDLVEPEWLYYELGSRDLFSIAKGAAQPVISSSNLKKEIIKLPEIAKQREFLEYVHLVNENLDTVNKQIGDIEELLDKKMDEYYLKD